MAKILKVKKEVIFKSVNVELLADELFGLLKIIGATSNDERRKKYNNTKEESDAVEILYFTLDDKLESLEIFGHKRR